VQVRDVMTREVFTVGPDTSAKYAAEVMADRGYAALPVVDDDYQLVGIVAEADVLQDRLPRDPRLHLRRDEEGSEPPPPLLVRGVMTVGVRTADAGADIADVARLFVDGGLRSVPVLEHDRLAGIVSRRDLLAALVRPDTEIRQDLVRLVEGYTGDPGCWEVKVVEGVATIGRTRGTPEVPAQVEERALRSLAHTVAGVVRVRILPASEEAAGRQNESAPAMGKDTSA
jgi:CBS domain-containing protein